MTKKFGSMIVRTLIIRVIKMDGLNFINFKTIKMPVKFKACEGGYIATDGLRMCKVTFEERFRIERIKSRTGPKSAYLEFLEIFRGGEKWRR